MNAPFRRVGLLGDVHCQHRALASALAFFRGDGCDAVLAVGDVVDGPGDVEATVQMLREHNVITVRGNHERWLLQNQMRSLADATPRDAISEASWEWLSALRPVQRVQTVAGELLLGHGLGSQDMQRVLSDDPMWCDPDDPTFVRFRGEAAGCRFAAGGHTHRRMVRDVCGVSFVNAGTLLPTNDPCAAVIDFAEGAVWHHDLVDDAVVRSPWQRVRLVGA